ncbi:hypothetical protein ZIOFF_060928 [Zingiber officinale]|uniref:Clp R domain-containing protein n=2 Tax=Zingiber officinale TaxID=94328 RepID=A0A8J5FPX5_ZINOF|nr:hypothetical protein ZIOFF_060928 [Zingiber officinale]
MVFMRTGVRAVHQALTAEVASVLKLSLDLAARRGHAQVTPLHVAATLISSSSASSDLLRRACLKSQPHRPSAFHHPLHCRALELCFNVALHRLPAATSPFSGALLPSPPSLSNSLIAAIKRAQANQRKGSIELDQQQPLLAIKVGMEQLMLSILDDPSVSRVMREAGFSSRCIKSHLEEDAYALSQSSPSLSEDLRMVIEAMLRKQGSTNTVVVGDSGSSLEGLVAELMRRFGRSEIPDELRHASFMNLQLSPSHLRLMRKADVESKVSDLRRTINSLASGRNGIIIYAGDLSWAVDDEATEHMVAAMGSLLSEFNSSAKNRVWLLATASYGTYRKCQTRQPSLEILWSLQAVVVPSGWLGLGLQASSSLDSRVSNICQLPVELLDLQRQLQEEIPWQSNSIPAIMKALHDCSTGDKVMALLIKGSDYIAKRRVALVMARSIFGSTDKLIRIKRDDSCCKIVMGAIRRAAQKCIVLVEDIDRMSDHFVKPFTDALKVGSFKDGLGEEVCLADAIFILTTSQVTRLKSANDVSRDEDASSSSDLERSSKRLRTEDHGRFDLNFEPYVNVEEETECISFHLPRELLQTSVQLSLNAGVGQYQELKVSLLTKLHRAFEEMQNGKVRKGNLVVDPEVAEELMQASGFFLESFFEKWAREVIRANLQTARDGGGNVRLSLQGRERLQNAWFLGFPAAK